MEVVIVQTYIGSAQHPATLGAELDSDAGQMHAAHGSRLRTRSSLLGRLG